MAASLVVLHAAMHVGLVVPIASAATYAYSCADEPPPTLRDDALRTSPPPRRGDVEYSFYAMHSPNLSLAVHLDPLRRLAFATLFRGGQGETRAHQAAVVVSNGASGFATSSASEHNATTSLWSPHNSPLGRGCNITVVPTDLSSMLHHKLDCDMPAYELFVNLHFFSTVRGFTEIVHDRVLGGTTFIDLTFVCAMPTASVCGTIHHRGERFGLPCAGGHAHGFHDHVHGLWPQRPPEIEQPPTSRSLAKMSYIWGNTGDGRNVSLTFGSYQLPSLHNSGSTDFLYVRAFDVHFKLSSLCGHRVSVRKRAFQDRLVGYELYHEPSDVLIIAESDDWHVVWEYRVLASSQGPQSAPPSIVHGQIGVVVFEQLSTHNVSVTMKKPGWPPQPCVVRLRDALGFTGYTTP